MEIPKTLRKYADKIDSMDDGRSTQNGYWCYLKRGWKSPNDPIGIEHQIHEDTIGTIASMLKDAPRCDCEDCLGNGVMDCR